MTAVHINHKQTNQNMHSPTVPLKCMHKHHAKRDPNNYEK